LFLGNLYDKNLINLTAKLRKENQDWHENKLQDKVAKLPKSHIKIKEFIEMKGILKLINDYQNAVKFGVEQMQKEFNTKQLLRAWGSKAIPKEGVLKSGIEYDFHGVGCMLTINNLDVDFDFGPDDRCDGFDAWRLGLFVNERPRLYKRYFENEQLLKNDFQELIEKNIVIKPGWFPGSSLCYFADAIK
jgi:hypothetical protein